MRLGGDLALKEVKWFSRFICCHRNGYSTHHTGMTLERSNWLEDQRRDRRNKLKNDLELPLVQRKDPLKKKDSWRNLSGNGMNSAGILSGRSR